MKIFYAQTALRVDSHISTNLDNKKTEVAQDKVFE